MEFIDQIYIRLAHLTPGEYSKHFRQLFSYSGISKDPTLWLGATNVLSLLLIIIGIIVPWSLQLAYSPLVIICIILLPLIAHLGSYLIVYFKVEARTKEVEKALPDALALIAANLKAGMAPFQALKLAGKTSFGALGVEIKNATQRALGTESFAHSLLQISKQFRSEPLERTLQLFTTSMKSGANLARLLEELSKDIAQTRSLKKDLITSTKTYVLFILFTIVIGTPLLLSVAIHFLTLVTETTGGVSGGDSFGMAFLAGEIAITPEFLTQISYIMLFLTSLFASLLIGTIQEGKPKSGLKIAPIIILVCFIVFAISRKLVGTIIGNVV